MTEHAIQTLRHVWKQRWFRFPMLLMYYLLIIAAMVYFYGRGNFSTPPFVYQGF